MEEQAPVPGHSMTAAQEAFIQIRRLNALSSRVQELERFELRVEDRLAALEARPKRKKKAAAP